MSNVSPKIPLAIGKYQIIDRLAVGGMAEIFLGRMAGPSQFERPVVIKRVLPRLEENRAFVDMLIDEARIVAAIRHPNVVQVQELVLHEGAPFLVMEFLEGESLGGLMRRLWVMKQPLDFCLAAYIIGEACVGLHSAHELTDSGGALRNVVHRDVSPQNIMITYDGRIKILDFGIAKFEGRSAHTEFGHFKGKFAYASPEQCKCEAVDRRADIFALGILLFELVVGRSLFKRESMSTTLQAVLFDPIPSPSQLVADVPEGLDKICQKALSRTPSERYPTAMDMRRELVQAARGLGGNELEDEVLARLMKSIFAERMDEKRELLAQVASGIKPDKIIEAEAEKSVEIPDITTLASKPSIFPPALPVPAAPSEGSLETDSGQISSPGGAAETICIRPPEAKKARLSRTQVSILTMAALAVLAILFSKFVWRPANRSGVESRQNSIVREPPSHAETKPDVDLADSQKNSSSGLNQGHPIVPPSPDPAGVGQRDITKGSAVTSSQTAPPLPVTAQKKPLPNRKPKKRKDEAASITLPSSPLPPTPTPPPTPAPAPKQAEIRQSRPVSNKDSGIIRW